MPVEIERPRPHGDPLENVINSNREDDRGQRQREDRAQGRGSTANGIPEFDEGARRRKQYDDGAEFVSETDWRVWVL